MPKRKLFEKLLFMLSLSGNLPLSDKISSMDLEEEPIKIITRNNRLIKIVCKEILVFDDAGIKGLTLEERADKIYKVIDWINVRSGTVHKFDYFSTEDDFVKEVFFYPSDRIDGNHDKKDIVAISHLTEEQVNNLD